MIKDLYKIKIKLRDTTDEDTNLDTPDVDENQKVDEPVDPVVPPVATPKVSKPKAKATPPKDNLADEVILTKEQYAELIKYKTALGEKEDVIRSLTSDVTKMKLEITNVNDYVTSVQKKEELLLKEKTLNEYTNKLYDEKPYVKEAVKNYLSKKDINTLELDDIDIFVTAVEGQLKEATSVQGFVNRGKAISQMVSTPKVNNTEPKNNQGVDKVGAFVNSVLKDLNL